MLESEFFTGIVGDKQLGDSLSSPSVPLLPALRNRANVLAAMGGN